jgi:hypothetical protein
MLNPPEQYLVNKSLDIGTFLTTDLTTAERKKLKEVLQGAVLEHQIAGENLPSLLDDEYDVQVILFIRLRLSNLKHARFVADKVQRLGKPHTVLLLQDGSDNMCLSFAHKRLNYQDKNQVVLLDEVITPPFSIAFDNEVHSLIHEYATFDKLLNKSSKLALYIEMMTKCAIIGNLSLWTESHKLLQGKIWYNTDKTLQLLGAYRSLEQYKREQKRAKYVSEQVEANSNLRRIYQDLMELTGLEYRVDMCRDSAFGKLSPNPDNSFLIGEVEFPEGNVFSVEISALDFEEETPLSSAMLSDTIKKAEQSFEYLKAGDKFNREDAAAQLSLVACKNDKGNTAYIDLYNSIYHQILKMVCVERLLCWPDGAYSVFYIDKSHDSKGAVWYYFDENNTCIELSVEAQ